MKGLKPDVRGHLVVFATVTIGASLLYVPNFREGLPPGVDTPTFLHFSWFVEETLHGRGGLTDPYWYGGLKVFQTYPPLAYSLVGLLAYATPLSLVVAYKIILLTAYLGLGMATYWLALELRADVVPAAVAAVLAITAYPVFQALGIWGWFTTLAALPLGIGSLAALERSLHYHSLRFAVMGGVLLGLSVLAHHMTAFALALVLLVWLPVRFLTLEGKQPSFFVLVAAFAAGTAVVTIWWAIPFLFHVATAGFQREVPGLWSFSFRQYRLAVANSDLIGLYVYPTYMGFTLLVLAVGGISLSLMERGRATAYGVAALALWIFSLGAQTNPLLRIRPLDGLDVARFHLFLVPFACVLSASYLGNVWEAVSKLIQRFVRLETARAVAAFAALGLVLAYPAYDAVRAIRSTLQPVHIDESAYAALGWLNSAEATSGKVLAVGWWNWDAFLVPLETGRPVMDGWYDEGTTDWRAIREVRHMMWSGNVDVPRLCQLMVERKTKYLLVYDYYPMEHPRAFLEALRSRPDLFREMVRREKVSIFERIGGRTRTMRATR